MSDKPHVSDLLGFSELSQIPYWCFVVAFELRPAVQYSGMTDVEWLFNNLFHISHLKPDGYESEEYYAMRKRLDEILLGLTRTAETEEEIDYILAHVGPFMSPAGEAIAEKAMRRRTPEKFRHHERSLKGRNGERSVQLDLADTEKDLERLVSPSLTAELPHFDTVTAPAYLKLAATTHSLFILKWIYDCTNLTMLDIRFAVA
jgi:hypothetical protein